MTRIVVSTVASLLVAGALSAESWPQFRGPAAGAAAPDGAKIPTEWSEKKNLNWKTELPGPGSSSPIFWDDKIFVTCYTGYGIDQKEIGEPGDLGRQLICIDRSNGEILWKKSVDLANPEDPYRGYLMEHGYASSTPVTDGKNVYGFFGKSGVHAFTVDGEKLWTTTVGDGSSNRKWGSAASPVLYKDLVIVSAADEAQAIVALDQKTGKERWRYESKNLELAFATPQLHKNAAGEDELIMSIPFELFALDPASGKRRWLAKTDVPGNVSPSVVIAEGLICAFGGYPRKSSLAVKAGSEEEGTIWKSKVTTYVPTPLAYKGHLYWVNDQAEVVCMKLADGEVITKREVEGLEGSKRMSFYASMVRVGDKLYAVSRHNGTFVFEATPEMKKIAQNKFEDRSDFSGTPAIAKDAMYIRSGKFLYCVGE